MATSTVVGTFDAKTHLSELLERVADGESFVITRRGQPIARLVPATPTATQLSIDEIIAGARALRLKVQAGEAEIRSWIDEGRA
jgi:prevent-host-death family protein